MTSHQIQDAAKMAASKIASNYGFTEHGSAAFAYLIASEFLPFAEDKPVEPLEIKQTSVPLNKV